MKINLRLWLCSLPLVTLLTLNLTRDKVAAQIIPDNTLGNENSVVKTINPQLKHIDGGAIRGINLFHSFREFNINEGNSTYFSNPAAIKNIFTRVTGNNPSQLFGKLGVLGDANLYFFNPNGIIFGRNASLDIRGSFVASTTPSLIFPDNKKFSATNPEAPPLLTNNVSIPVGLQFEGMSGTITNAANLKVGKDLKLVSENLDLENQIHAQGDLTLQATDTVKIRDSNDNPFIATAGGKLQISGDRNVDIFALNNPNSGLFSGGDMVLRSSNQVGGDAHFAAGGNFRIENLDGSLGDLYSPFDPVIRANGDVSLDSYSGASLHIFAGGLVYIPGTVSILSADDTANSIAETVTLSNGETIEIDGSKEPTLDIRAGTTAFGDSFVDTGTPTSADIIIGNIQVFDDFNGTAGKVFLTNQYQPNTALDTLFGGITVGSIDTRDVFGGGSVTIDSRSQINLDGAVDVSAFSIDGNFLGNAGNVNLLAGGDITTSSQILSNGLLAGNVTLTSARDVLLTNGAEINVRGAGGGNIAINAQNLEISGGTKLRAGIGEAQGSLDAQAGNIDINVAEKTTLSDEGSSIGNNLDFFDSIGKSGDININTGSLEVKNGAFLIGNIFGEGDSGTININAENSVKFDGGGIQNLVVGIGNSGGINISTGSFEANNDSQLNTSTFGTGNAGKVNITARDNVTFADYVIFSSVESGAIGNGGDINITGNSLDMIDTQLITNTLGIGNAGSLTISAGAIKFNDSQIYASSLGIGNAADVNITAQDSFILDNSQIFARTDSQSEDSIVIGNSGNINIDTRLLQMSNGAQLNIIHNGIGNPGNVNINADTVSLNASTINNTAFLENAGNVNIKASGSVSLKDSNIYTLVASENSQGGDIIIDAKSLFLTDFSILVASQYSNASSEGSAGNITVKTHEFVTLDNSSSISASAFAGSGGEILIDTKKLSVQNGSVITAIVLGDKPAASLTVNATESVEISGFDDIVYSGLSINTLGNGDAGNLTINTGKLIVKDGGEISTSAALTPGVSEQFGLSSPTGTGKAGNLIINADESVQIIGSTPDGVSSWLSTSGGGGDGGKIEINTPKLRVTDGALISASTSGIGKGGTIEINAPLSVEVTGTHPIFTSIRSNISTNSSGIYPTEDGGEINFATVNAGDIKIITPQLKVTDGAQISALTTGGGKGGTIEINSKSISLNNDAEITARTLGEKKAGEINLTADSLEVNNGSQITTSTYSSGKAGDITLTVKDYITLIGEGSGILSTTLENSTGDGGKIIIDPILFTIEDGATIAVNSQGTGIGGDIEFTADTLNLDNGTINAQTRSNTGGNITLNVNDITYMRRDSKISTTAGNEQFGGNGGNITINSPFIVAFPTNGDGNDITANAFLGNGGNVNITGEFLFGIESRDKLTAFNDITASSEFAQDGTVEINTVT